MTLAPLRAEIDRLDAEIAALVAARAAVAREIGRLKPPGAVRDPAREAEVLARARAALPDLPPAQVESVWRALIALCTAVQQP
jgi:chorismate mutase/prephenate dehydratase